MADSLTIDVETTACFAALDAVPATVYAHTMPASKVTADRIADEARGRMRRRTGQTAAAITVEETYKGDGYVIFVGGGRTAVGRYLEYGTRFMNPKPFLWASARLEEGAHESRERAAVEDGIAATGLGE